MSNYDFLNLSPSDFEDLSRDLLQKEWQITLETFASGRDNGIDLRYSTANDEEIIIQCKRYSDYKSFFSNLKKEKEKVFKLKPRRYIVSTSVGLSPSRKDQIVNLFSPYIKSTADVYGKDDINNLISKYPEIERQHFKLWLSNSTILDKILNSKIYNQSNFEIETIKETVNVYVDNESYYKAIEIIKDKKYVIISGIPGIGKTTLARVLVFHYLANGFEDFIYLSDSINDGYTLYKEGRKQIFLFDDFLGTNFLENKLSNNEEQRIVKFIEKISKSKDKIIIFTTREYILAQAKQKYDAFNNQSLKFAKCIIDLSQYTKLVKAKILYNHLYFSNIPESHILNLLDNNAYLKIINHRTYNPRIIQTITNDDFWKTIDSDKFSENFLEFIENPQSVWKHVFENQISKLSQIILVNLMACGSPILLNDLKLVIQNFARHFNSKYGIIYSEIEFTKSIRELENTFIKTVKDKDNVFAIEYQNPSVQDFLVFYFRDYSDYITDILECTLFFNQMFRVFSFKNDFGYSVQTRILLSNDNINIVVNRIINEFDVFKSSTLKGSTYHRFYKDDLSIYNQLDTLRYSIKIDEIPELEDFVKKTLVHTINTHKLQDFEFDSFINLIEGFQYDIEFNAFEIINACSEHVTDINELDTFERFESVFFDYSSIVKDDENIKKRIITILELEAEHTEEDFEETKTDLISRAQKYNIDYSDIEAIIEKKIVDKNENDDIDWSAGNKSKNNDSIDDKEIKNIFDSLR
ncbi:restriction endonuclease [Flavobacterium sandaracinum]|uniref:Uncharacterized protein n=1 Tax=Flavobacterium sandaracinum TaxID=2541733 RepID=A0A4R5CQD7_9FLAO|nr:restriction endonuclease [Flavobacterium sandaracinum]TDE01530.1 hypothetical protein E0F91_14340 [Flavobacterium sandaracinum]